MLVGCATKNTRALLVRGGNSSTSSFWAKLAYVSIALWPLLVVFLVTVPLCTVDPARSSCCCLHQQRPSISCARGSPICKRPNKSIGSQVESSSLCPEAHLDSVFRPTEVICLPGLFQPSKPASQ